MNRGFSPWGIFVALRAQEIAKESVPQLPGRRFYTDVFLCRMLGDVVAVGVKLQIVNASQVRDEFLIGVGFGRAQFVIEMNHREDYPEFVPQFQQQPQERNGINPTGNGYADAIPSPQQFHPPNVGKHALRQLMHGNMVQPSGY